MMLPMMVANLKEYVDAAKGNVGKRYRFANRHGKSIEKYEDTTNELEFDEGIAVYLSLQKAENFGFRSVDAFVDHVFRHELHHCQGLDEAADKEGEIHSF